MLSDEKIELTINCHFGDGNNWFSLVLIVENCNHSGLDIPDLFKLFITFSNRQPKLHPIVF